MTELEEYQKTGMLGGYQPERVKRGKVKSGKVVPFYPDGVRLCAEDSAVGITREVYIDGCLIRVHSLFDLHPTKTPTDAMLRVIDGDLEKDSTSG